MCTFSRGVGVVGGGGGIGGGIGVGGVCGGVCGGLKTTIDRTFFLCFLLALQYWMLIRIQLILFMYNGL